MMEFPAVLNHVLRALCLAGLLVGGGCATSSDDRQRYIPSDESALQILETALKAWQQSGKPGQVQEAGPAIHLADSHQKPGQKLAAFEILGTAAGDADRCYSVRLVFDGPHEEVRARFVIYGWDPVWVVRYED